MQQKSYVPVVMNDANLKQSSTVILKEAITLLDQREAAIKRTVPKQKTLFE